MSLDLVVLSEGSAQSYEQALKVYYEESSGVADEARLQAFADEIDEQYGEDNWPFTGDPIVMPAHVLLTVAPESWEAVVPDLVEVAHRHGFVVLDPQDEKLFPPGTKYE